MRVPDAIGDVPHWARVAFAARCARRAVAVFRRSWPDATPRHLKWLETATRLAENSAAKGQPRKGLHDAVIKAMRVAGVAIMGTHGFPTNEPVPADEAAATSASFAAKAAEKAAEAARAAPTDSALQALEAYTFVRDAAHLAETTDVLEGLQADFDNLYRVAKRGRWTNETCVPASVFGLMADEDESSKPWWKFW